MIESIAITLGVIYLFTCLFEKEPIPNEPAPKQERPPLDVVGLIYAMVIVLVALVAVAIACWY